MSTRFKGTFEDCITHFSETNKEALDRDKCKARTTLSTMLDVKFAVVYRWFTSDVRHIPTGLNRQKVLCLLEIIGYSVIGHIDIMPVQRKLCYQIGMGIVTVTEVARLFGISEDPIIRWADGRRVPHVQYAKRLEAFVEKYSPAMEEKLQHWQDILKGLGIMMLDSTEEVVSQHNNGQLLTSTRASESNGIAHEHVIESLAHMIHAAHRLAEEVVSESFSDEEREELRQLTTVGRKSKVFELSNTLSRLCSERARQDII